MEVLIVLGTMAFFGIIYFYIADKQEAERKKKHPEKS